MKKLLIFIFLSVSLTQLYPSKWPKRMVITVPVADVRHNYNSERLCSYDKIDPYQTTQVLFGDKVLALGEENGFLKIRTLEQKIYVNGVWSYCPGWIKADQATMVKKFPKYNLVTKNSWTMVYDKDYNQKFSVSFGTRFYSTKCRRGICSVTLPSGEKAFLKKNSVNNFIVNKKPKKIRKSIVQLAESFLGTPYFFGGYSFHKKSYDKNVLTGVDCSSFTCLCYKIYGINLPRNALSQYRYCRKIKSNVKEGDLVFLSRKKDPKNIFHVMIYIGDGQFIEPKGGIIRKVIKTNSKNTLGVDVRLIKSGDKIPGNFTKGFEGGFVYFGSVL
jgi:cell wall-associated NlpC family hydrolase